MPAVLSDKKVCHPFVPLNWQPVLELLVDFQDSERRLREEPKNQALILEIQQLHDRLITESESLLEPHSLDDLPERDQHAMFARSVYLLMRIASSVAGDNDILDTAGCRTLHLYEADFLADPNHQDKLRVALAKTCCLTKTELDDIECHVEADVRKASRKHRVVEAIRSEFDLREAADDLQGNIFRFFDAMYPHVGIAPEEVELIITGTMIFFCLPFDKDELTTERYRHLSSEDQQPVREFLRRVNRFSQWQFAHFPVFGFRRGHELDDQLLESLAAKSRLSAAEVAAEISTLSAIIPITELDKYVVHDIWGHSWQACMLGFDRLYAELADFADPLQLSESASSPYNNELTFEQCFVGDGDNLTLDVSTFDRFVNLEVAERLPIAMTPVLAEVLADVAEFKLLATGQTDELATSSVLRHFPAKLDLTIRDVTFYFRQATKVFRLWATKSARQRQTIKGLIARGGSEKASAAAVAQAVRRWHRLEDEWLAPEINFRRDGENLRVNVVARLALNFLAIHRETLTVYERLGKLDAGNLPLKGFRDLLLIGVAVFFETAPSLNLWRVDEFLSLKIEPLCEQLVRDGLGNGE